MDGIDKMLSTLTNGIMNHVNAITINAYLHGIFGENTDENGIPLGGIGQP